MYDKIHYKLKKKKSAAYQNVWDTVKTVIRKNCVTLKNYTNRIKEKKLRN